MSALDNSLALSEAEDLLNFRNRWKPRLDCDRRGQSGKVYILKINNLWQKPYETPFDCHEIVCSTMKMIKISNGLIERICILCAAFKCSE